MFVCLGFSTGCLDAGGGSGKNLFDSFVLPGVDEALQSERKKQRGEACSDPRNLVRFPCPRYQCPNRRDFRIHTIVLIEPIVEFRSMRLITCAFAIFVNSLHHV